MPLKFFALFKPSLEKIEDEQVIYHVRWLNDRTYVVRYAQTLVAILRLLEESPAQLSIQARPI